MPDWIVLRPALHRGEVWLGYEDNLGERWPRQTTSRAAARRSFVIELLGWKIRVFKDLSERLAAGIHGTDLSFPLFLGDTPSMSIADAARIARAAVEYFGHDLGALELVVLSRDAPGDKVLRLPLRIRWPGHSGALDFQDDWRQLVTVVDATQDAEIVVTDQPPPPSLDARLVVSFAPVTTRTSSGYALIDATGVAVDRRVAVVRRILGAILRDIPLHEVVHSVARSDLVSLTLTSGWGANQSLRLSDAVLALFEEVKELSDTAAFNRAGADAIARRERAEAEERRKPGSAAAQFAWTTADPSKLAQSIEHRAEELWNVDLGNLAEVGNLAQGVAGAQVQAEPLRTLIEGIHASPETRKSLYPREERRVDIALLRRDLRETHTLFVPKDSTLAAGRRYRLRVQVGRPLPQSIMVGDVASLDALLPPRVDAPGHVLTVVVYPLDFGAVSYTARKLVLPPEGPSLPLFFDVAAPKASGTARMRVAIYYELPPDNLEGTRSLEDYRNQLVQSFLIDAAIADAETLKPWPVTTARVEVSRRVRFERLDTLGPRLASLGFNESAHRSHTFHFKRGLNHGNVDINTTAMTHALRSIRTELRTATYLAKRKPRFPETNELVRGGRRERDFDEAIRNLGRAGERLHSVLRTSLPSRKEPLLDDIRASHDKTLQIIRYDHSFAFPWSMVYDFPRPRDKDAAVCKGFLREKEGKPMSAGECLADCPHPAQKDAFCVWGFWGFRHAVEQVLHAPSKEEATIEKVTPVPAGAVVVDVGIKGPFANKLVPDLRAVLKDAVVPLAPPQELIPTLWSNETRPAIAIVLGHHKVEDDEPAILTSSGWLMRHEFAGRKPKWGDPHTVVILAACGSAAVDPSSLVSLVNEFAWARASAVIGTETTIFEGLAYRLARTLALDLMSQKSLGTSLLEFRRSLLRLLNPLGLAVTAYGDADLFVG